MAFKVSDYNEPDFGGGGKKIPPEGRYHLLLKSAIKKPIKNKDGDCAHLTFEILDAGEHQGVAVKHWIIGRHPDKKTQSAGANKMAALCIALGLGGFESLSELENESCEARLYHEQEEWEGREYTNVRIGQFFPNGEDAARQAEAGVGASTGNPDEDDGIPF